ncbi:YgdI/YgdR family lipoprotein [Pseudomonas lundensis]|uniref:YgdI/YgdR family lipoprotein n=1 Tax=Pseudomonas lundensis TaxID=86185 RepID=UPI00385B46B5
MKINVIAVPLVMVAMLGLAGCASPSVVTLQNGTQYLTKDLPKTKTNDGFYEFVDIAGKHIRIKAEDVATIKTDD